MGAGLRVLELRKALGLKQGRAAQALTDLVGGEPIAPTRFSEWENEAKPVDRYILAAIALLHPDNPHGCLLWLRGKDATMPVIRSRKPAGGSDGLQVTPGAKTPIKPAERRRQAGSK